MKGFTQGMWSLKEELEMLGFNCSPISIKEGYSEMRVSETTDSDLRDWFVTDLRFVESVFDSQIINDTVAVIKFK